jgi:hypothetical protein
MGFKLPDNGNLVFLRLPSGAERELLPMRVLSVRSHALTAECEDCNVDASAGTEALMFFKDDGPFTRQRIRIDAVMPGEARTVIGFTTLGHPEIADSRRSHRVTAEAAGLFATIGSEERCLLLDVSIEGFAVISSATHRIGDLVAVILHYGNERFKGTACIQSAHALPDGRWRYGLQSVGDRVRGGGLQRGQLQIGIGIQRAELDQLTRV